MILLVQIICLCYTLYVLQEYATSGAYSRQHRLLPLLVGLIGVYNFYQVVLTLTGQTELFGRLKDMLLIQVLYLILIYIMDFLKIHIPYGVQWIMFCVLLALNVIVFMRYRQPEIYHIYFRIYLIGCTAAIVAMGTYAYLRRSLTMHEHQIANLLYIVLLVNAAAMCAEKFFTIPGNLLMLAATTGVCGAVHYLIQTDQLMDTGELLRERLYDDSDTAVVLLDTNFYCVDANRSGRSLFAGPMQLYERNSRRHRGYMQEAEELAKSIQEGKKSREIEKNGQYYQCQCTPVYYSGRLRGYILGAWDITSPKKETQLMQALKGKAEMQTARKSDFLAQMSHDLKSPLHAIIGPQNPLYHEERESVTLEELREFPCVINYAFPGDFSGERIWEGGARRNAEVLVSDLGSALQIVSRTGAVAIDTYDAETYRTFYAANDCKYLALKDAPIDCKLGWVMPKNHTLSQACGEFLEILREKAELTAR